MEYPTPTLRRNFSDFLNNFFLGVELLCTTKRMKLKQVGNTSISINGGDGLKNG